MEAIEKISSASQKSTKIAEYMLGVDQEKSMISIFSIPGNNPVFAHLCHGVGNMKIIQVRKRVKFRLFSCSHASCNYSHRRKPKFFRHARSSSYDASVPVERDEFDELEKDIAGWLYFSCCQKFPAMKIDGILIH